MTFEKLHKAVGNRIEDKWNAAETFILAANQPGQPPGTAPWVRWSVRPAVTLTADATATFERTTGLIFFQIFVPENKGERGAMRIRDRIASAFNEARFVTDDGGVIRCGRAEIDFVGRDSDGWSQFNSTVRFTADAQAVNSGP